jgi:actin related protein 2/3 complex, subunit 1A/1B
VTIAYPAGPEEPPHAIINVCTPLLPFETLLWINENEIVTAGHDCQPIVFVGSDQGWYEFELICLNNRQLGPSLDVTAKSASSRDNEPSAFNMFRNMDRKGSVKAATEDTSLPTVHQNTITYVHLI